MRIGDELWLPAQWIADQRQEDMTAVIERFLARYIEDNTALLKDFPYSRITGNTDG